MRPPVLVRIGLSTLTEALKLRPGLRIVHVWTEHGGNDVLVLKVEVEGDNEPALPEVGSGMVLPDVPLEALRAESVEERRAREHREVLAVIARLATRMDALEMQAKAPAPQAPAPGWERFDLIPRGAVKPLRAKIKRRRR